MRQQMGRDVQLLNIYAKAAAGVASKEGAKAFNALIKKLTEDSK